MESLVGETRAPDPAVWNGLSVLVTGHTGFKGGWLTHWLASMGAIAHGLALDPPTEPSLFQSSNVASLLASDSRGNISDIGVVKSALALTQPTVVIHMAAQPLVRESYASPVETFETNVMGTVNVLEAVRGSPSVKVVVVVTTDKVYRNREWPYPYREIDELGGRDPYSASKSAAEFVVESFSHSFFLQAGQQSPWVVSARAGNVIGGGDWSQDRLVPDIVRALESKKPLRLRNPKALRPWHHVLDAICGYLLLAESCLVPPVVELPRSWNFGPASTELIAVTDLVERFTTLWGTQVSVETEESDGMHETQTLILDSALAHKNLNWKPRWPIHRALQETVEWTKSWSMGDDMADVTRRQISAYINSVPSP